MVAGRWSLRPSAQNRLRINFLTRGRPPLRSAQNADGEKIPIADPCRGADPSPSRTIPVKDQLPTRLDSHYPAIIGLHAAYRAEIDRRNCGYRRKLSPVSSPRPTQDQRRAPHNVSDGPAVVCAHAIHAVELCVYRWRRHGTVSPTGTTGPARDQGVPSRRSPHCPTVIAGCAVHAEQVGVSEAIVIGGPSGPVVCHGEGPIARSSR